MEAKIPKQLQELADLYGAEVCKICDWKEYEVFQGVDNGLDDPDELTHGPRGYFLYNPKTEELRTTEGNEHLDILAFISQ